MKKEICLWFAFIINMALIFSQERSVSWDKEKITPDVKGVQFIFFDVYTDFTLEKQDKTVSLVSPLTNIKYSISCDSEEQAQTLFEYISLRITYYIAEDGTWYHHTVKVKGIDGNYVTGYAGGGENKRAWKEFLDYLVSFFETPYTSARSKYINNLLYFTDDSESFLYYVKSFMPTPHFYYSSVTADHLYIDINNEEAMKDKIFSCYSEKKASYWKIQK